MHMAIKHGNEKKNGSPESWNAHQSQKNKQETNYINSILHQFSHDSPIFFFEFIYIFIYLLKLYYILFILSLYYGKL